jgi:hypothetical protein
MSLRRLLAAAIAVAVAAGGTGAWLVLRPAGGGASSGPVDVGGPLASPPDATGIAVSVPTAVGERVSFGYLTLRAVPARRLTLERVSLLRVRGGLRLVGSYVQPAGIPRYAVGLLFGFPPPNAAPNRRPTAGFVLRGRADVAVVVGLRTTRPGIAQFRSLRLWYRDGARRYRTDFLFAVRLCAPRERYRGRCHAPLR